MPSTYLAHFRGRVRHTLSGRHSGLHQVQQRVRREPSCNQPDQALPSVGHREEEAVGTARSPRVIGWAMSQLLHHVEVGK